MPTYEITIGKSVSDFKAYDWQVAFPKSINLPST